MPPKATMLLSNSSGSMSSSESVLLQKLPTSRCGLVACDVHFELPHSALPLVTAATMSHTVLEVHCIGCSSRYALRYFVAFHELEPMGLPHFSNTFVGELHLLWHALLLLLQKPLSLIKPLNRLARLPSSRFESSKAVEFCQSLLRCMQA